VQVISLNVTCDLRVLGTRTRPRWKGLSADPVGDCTTPLGGGKWVACGSIRGMTELRNASRRGAPSLELNPPHERASERFATPQDPLEMVTLSSALMRVSVVRRAPAAASRYSRAS
jgi:hypothetical protein